jgi:hypothetical protein
MSQAPTPHNYNPQASPARQPIVEAPCPPSWQPCIPVRLIDAPRLLGASHLAPQHMLYILRLAWYPPGAQAPGAACNGSIGENDGPRGARTSLLLAHIHDYASEDPVEKPQNTCTV